MSAGEPIPGANVFWMNTTNGVTTNEDGNFSIHKPARSHMLVVSFIGFENDTIHVDKGNQQLDIVLREGVELSEVNVVTRKLGTMKLRTSVIYRNMRSHTFSHGRRHPGIPYRNRWAGGSQCQAPSRYHPAVRTCPLPSG